MPSGETQGPRAERPGEPVTEALGRLEARLERAQEAAERLLADAADRLTEPETGHGSGAAAGTGSEAGSETETETETEAEAEAGSGTGSEAGRAPPRGWQQPRPEAEPRSSLRADADVLLALVAALRERLPPDLQRRLIEAVREVLLALRALIDWYLERTEESRSGPCEVQDIPIL